MSVNWCITSGIGKSRHELVAFDKALLDAGVGNYNLVRLSSILPARAVLRGTDALRRDVEDGMILPTAYATISSNIQDDVIISAIGVGLPKDQSQVGVIMEYSTKNTTCENALKTLDDMICEALHERDWEVDKIIHDCVRAKVEVGGMNYVTFACISEW